MPIIDVYFRGDLIPASRDRDLAAALTLAVLRAEGVTTPGPFHLDNTAAYIHRLDASAVHTANTAGAKTVRVQIITPPGALSRAGQRQIVKEATEIVTDIVGEAEQKGRTWIILTEGAEGGWGLQGIAFGKEEFAAAAKAAAEKKAAAAASAK